MYNPNRLSGIRRMNQLKNPIDSCVVLSDNWRTFELIQSSVVALAKSQDHRVIYGVFAFGDIDNFVELKCDLVAQLHNWCIASSVATCLMLNDDSIAKQQGVLEVYLVRFQATRQSYLLDRQGALANGLHGLNPINTDIRTHPLFADQRWLSDW